MSKVPDLVRWMLVIPLFLSAGFLAGIFSYLAGVFSLHPDHWSVLFGVQCSSCLVALWVAGYVAPNHKRRTMFIFSAFIVGLNAVALIGTFGVAWIGGTFSVPPSESIPIMAGQITGTLLSVMGALHGVLDLGDGS